MAEPAASTPAPLERRQVHLRRISCEGFARSDGLFDIVGTLIDTKPMALELPERRLQPNEPIHHMEVTLTIDRQWTIRDVQARTVASPYGVCGAIADSYRQLIGMRIEPGFTDRVKRMFRGVAGCTHMTELLPPMGTTAFQILWGEPEGFGGPDAPASRKRTSPLNGCHALKTEGAVVQTHFSHLLDDDTARYVIPQGSKP